MSLGPLTYPVIRPTKTSSNGKPLVSRTWFHRARRRTEWQRKQHSDTPKPGHRHQHGPTFEHTPEWCNRRAHAAMWEVHLEDVRARPPAVDQSDSRIPKAGLWRQSEQLTLTDVNSGKVPEHASWNQISGGSSGWYRGSKRRRDGHHLSQSSCL